MLTLLEAGHEVVVIDNLCNASSESINRVEALSGKSLAFYQADVRDVDQVRAFFLVMLSHRLFTLPRLKSVGESVCKPLEYTTII